MFNPLNGTLEEKVTPGVRKINQRASQVHNKRAAPGGSSPVLNQKTNSLQRCARCEPETMFVPLNGTG